MNDELAITVEFEATEADHYRAVRAAAARHPAVRWMTLALLAAPLVLIALTMSGGYTLREAIFRNLFWIILAPLFVFVTGPLSQRSQARRAHRLHQHGPTRQVFTFDVDGVRLAVARIRRRSAGMRSAASWRRPTRCWCM